ncbi:hypothetical protein MDA_GLEAN10022552 [Myotis davidii]|uniref:Uncharacterized protein n=1 Tax=Myotis davidii TaxID=225400 RepID=L5MDF7_MYODS|nr:hypothetical protein MDA_GLEAN10022552 [Myotis davidii]
MATNLHTEGGQHRARLSVVWDRICDPAGQGAVLEAVCRPRTQIRDPSQRGSSSHRGIPWEAPSPCLTSMETPDIQTYTSSGPTKREAKPSAEDLENKKEGEYIKLKVIGLQ